MIANITILENGSYSPNQEVFFGNKYDNLKNNYLVLTIPNEYRNYYHYMYGQCGKANILLPCNYVDGELRFYITSSITKTPGRWEMVFIAAQEALDINSSLSANQIIFGAQRFISSTFIGVVQDNNLTNPPLTDLNDENLIIYYERLNQLEKDLNKAWTEGKLDGPYYIPTVEDGAHGEALLQWEGSREGMPEIATVDIRGKQGKQGPYYVPSEEDGILSWTGTQTGMEEVESTNIKEWVENASETYLDVKLPEEVNTAVDEKFKYVWDTDTQTLYINARENDSESDNLPPSQVEQILDKVETLEQSLETIPEKAIKIVDELPQSGIENNVIYGVKKEQANYNSYLSIFGTRIPFINSMESMEQDMSTILELLKSHMQQEDAQFITMLLNSGGFRPIDVSFDGGIIRNTFDTNLKQFVYYLSAENIEVGPKYFNTIEDLSNYLLEGGIIEDFNSIDSVLGTDFSQLISIIKNYGYKFSTTSISEDEFGAVYNNTIEITYDYYIYNNKEWKSLNSIETVSSLPTKNIKVNTIYSLKKPNYEGYFYIFGNKIPEITVENADPSMETVATKLSNQGFSSEEIDKIMTALSCSLIPINVAEYGLNTFDKDSQKYICRYLAGNIHKEFNTIKEMENYFIMGQFISDLRAAGTDESSVNEIANGIELLKSRLEFNYTNSSPATISAVVYEEKPEDVSYNYFIYDGEKWIELGKGGIPSISLTISDFGPDNTYQITDEDLETIINNDIVIANVSLDIGDEGSEISYKLFKTASIKMEDNNEIVMSTITNIVGSTTPAPYYLKLIVNLTTKTYTIDFNNFASNIAIANNSIYLVDASGEPIGSSVYIYTINGENIVGEYNKDITTSIKIRNKTVSNWVRNSTYANYPYRASITDSAVTANMFAEVIYGLAEAESGNYAPICQTFNGGIYIYSKVNTNIIIPTILVVK